MQILAVAAPPNADSLSQRAATVAALGLPGEFWAELRDSERRTQETLIGALAQQQVSAAAQQSTPPADESAEKVDADARQAQARREDQARQSAAQSVIQQRRAAQQQSVDDSAATSTEPARVPIRDGDRASSARAGPGGQPNLSAAVSPPIEPAGIGTRASRIGPDSSANTADRGSPAQAAPAIAPRWFAPNPPQPTAQLSDAMPPATAPPASLAASVPSIAVAEVTTPTNANGRATLPGASSRAPDSPVTPAAVRESALRSASPPAADTTNPPSSSEDAVDSRIEQMMRVLKAQITRRDARATIRLDPPELGFLRVDLRFRGSAIDVRIDASQPVAREMLERDLDRLRAGLEDAGFTIERIEVRGANVASDIAPPESRGLNSGSAHDGRGRESSTGSDTKRPPDDSRVSSAAATEETHRESRLLTESRVNLFA